MKENKMDWKRLFYRKKAGYDLLFSIMLSVVFILTINTHFTGGVWGTIEENYISDPTWICVPLFLAGVLVFYLLLGLIDPVFRHALTCISSKETRQEKKGKIIAVWFCILIIAWLPYVLSYYPGGVYKDTLSSMSYAVSGILTNRHPFLYNELLALVIKIGALLGKSITWSVGLLMIFQMTLLGMELLYFLYWMQKHRVHRGLRRAIMIFMVFFPLIPLYGISVWKDTPFCMAFLFWMLFCVDLYLELQDGKWRTGTMAGYVLGAFGVAFTRNNGIYIIFLSILCLIAVTLKRKILKKKQLYAGLLLTFAAAAGIQGPVYSMIGVEQTETVESLGIPLQQIGSAVAYDGNITEEQKEILDRFIPYEQIKPNFSPGLADHLKWYTDLDGEYLASHTGEFLKLWFSLLKQNPGIYVKEYLLQTAGFWNVTVSAPDAYAQIFVWENLFEIEQTDYFQQIFGVSFQQMVNPKHYISGAWFFWLFFFSCFFVVKWYRWKPAALFAPPFSLWLTLMIATPIAVSLRYIAALLFALPMIVLIPVLLERRSADAGAGELSCEKRDDKV